MTHVKRRRGACFLLALTTYAALTTFLCIVGVIQTNKRQTLIEELRTEIILLENEVWKINDQITMHETAEHKIVNEDTAIDIQRTSYQVFTAFIDNHLSGLTEYISVDEFYAWSIFHDIDPGFALATMILETGWLKSDLWMNGNNPAGLKCGERYCSFLTKSQGVDRMLTRMSEYVRGSVPWIGTKRTVAEVREKWSTTDDTDTIIDLWNQILGS